MSLLLIAFLMAVGLSIVTVLADSLIKHASMQPSSSGWLMLALGAIIYGLTAFGWFFVMKKMKLSTVGVIYGLSCVILLALVSVFYFKEKISSLEIVGIVMAIASIVLLSRFA